MIVFLLLAAFIAPTAGEVPRPQFVLAQRQSGPKPEGKPRRDVFDLLPKAAPPTAATLARQRERERQPAKRRTMFFYQQIGGFLTLGSLTATAVLGQLDYRDKYGGGGDVGTYRAWHRWVAVATTAIFAGTASLAVFAPVPVEKPAGVDTATGHKNAMTGAAPRVGTPVRLGIATPP